MGVLFGALLGVDGEGAEVLGEGFFGVELGVEGWGVFEQPFFALFGCAAVFTVLLRGVSLVDCPQEGLM